MKRLVVRCWLLVTGVVMAMGARAAELPEGYTAVEYLIAPYGAHIDTGYTANGQTKVVFDAVVSPRSEQKDRFGVLFGSRTMTAWAEKAFALQMCTGNSETLDTVRFVYNGEYRQDGGKPFSFGERVTVTCDGRHVEWTGSKAASVAFSADPLASSKSTLYIFADNTVSDDGAKSETGLNPSVMQLYSFKIYEGGTLKRDFVPVLNEKGERGMIDLANDNEFHPLINDYAGQSIVRVPAVVVPKGAFIDTGIKPDSETRVTMDVLIDRGESFGVLEGEYWFGCWDEDYNKGAFAFGNDGTGVYAGYGNQGGTVGSIVADGRHTVELDGNKVKVDGADYHSFTNESFALKQNLYLFAQNRAGFPIPFVSAYQSRIICMGCKIYHGGKLVRDYVPARMALIGGPYGLYDRVEGVFHGREGTVYCTNADPTNPALISDEISNSATLMYRRWDEDSNGLVFAVSPQKCTFIDEDTTELKNDCWYAAVGDVTLDHGLTLNNSVHLILTDGCCLEAHGGEEMAGIEVEWGTTNDKLHIYGQEGDTGRLVARGGRHAAGIGGSGNSSYGRHCGEIYIHGGMIEAYGGDCGAGIGGGYRSSEKKCGDGPVVLDVYGGKVMAFAGSGWAAGIGGGGASGDDLIGGSCGSIAVFGGVVEAYLNLHVGIGPGGGGKGYGTDMDLRISGGRVFVPAVYGADPRMLIQLPSPDDLEVVGSPVSYWNKSGVKGVEYLVGAFEGMGFGLTISREPVGTRWNPWRIGTTPTTLDMDVILGKRVPNGDVWAYREDDSIICNGQGSISASAFLSAIALSGLDVKKVKKLVIGNGITAIEENAFTLMGTEKPVQLELPGNWPADDRPTSIYVPWRGGYFYTQTYTLTIPSAEPLEITEVVIDGVAQKELPASAGSRDYVVCAGSRVSVRYRFAGRTLEETQTIGASGPDGEWIPAPMAGVSYLDAEGNECQANAMVITERTKMFGDSPWAVALLAVTNQVGLAVASGSAANLILADGAALAADLSVPQGSTLNVYCQAAGTGGLKAIKGSGGAVTIYGGCLGVRPLDVWIPGGRKIVDNPDPSLRTAYPYAVKPAARDCTVTIGQHWYMDAFWTYGDGTETNAVEGVSFRVSEGTVGVKVIFRPHACFAVVGSGVVELGEMPGADVVFGEGNDYRVPDVSCTLTDIQYLDWDAAVGRMTNAVLSAGSYEVVGPDTVSFEGGKWYVAVKEEVITTDHVIEVAPGNGSAANLILMDGASLTVSGGIGVDVGKALNIYGQSDGGGKLIANGSVNCAGIGGRNPNQWSGYGNCGTVTVNGGSVTATGGRYGAGIGGGEAGAGGEVTINGGTVTAQGGDYGTGIGGGEDGAGGKVTINGGTVTATGGKSGAGIGGGNNRLGMGDRSGVGEVTINGGTVTATGGQDGAGIGGGYYVAGGDVTISGGTVTATGGAHGAGIGGGLKGAGGMVTINGGEVTATGNGGGKGIGGGGNAGGGSVSINGGRVKSEGWDALGEKITLGKNVAAYDITGGEPGTLITEEASLTSVDKILAVVEVVEVETFDENWYVVVPRNTYINTYFEPDSNARVEMKVKVQGASEYWFGCWDGNWDDRAFALGNDGSTVYCGYGSGVTCGGIPGVISSGRVTVALEKGVVYTNGVVWSAAHESDAEFSLNNNLYLFAQNRNGTVGVGGSQGTIICYGCQISTNDANGAAVPVRNFVPARTKDARQIVGLYDTVSGEFYVPRDGTLTLGHDEEPREMDPIGVCSWSWHEPMTNIIRRMEANGFKGIQLALSPWVWEGEGSAAQKETFGDQEGEEVFNLISNKFAKGELDIHATMICFSNEDYTTEHTISNTCGFYYGLAPSATEEQKELADLTWEIRSNQFAKAVERTRALGVRNITAHIGLSEYDDANMSRLYWACKTCRENGCKLLVETGMYSAERTVAALVSFTNLHPDAEIGLNFDTANQVLYGADNPTNAYAVMKGWIEQVHIKDCVETYSARGSWATDVEWGRGDVSRTYDMISVLKAFGFAGPMLVEHESGSSDPDVREREILTAVKAIRGESAPVSAGLGEVLGPYLTAEAAAKAVQGAEFTPSAEVAAALGTDDARATYCNMFEFDVVLTAGGKWAVAAFLKPQDWTNVVESAQAATRQIPVAKLAAQEYGTPLENVPLTNCVPGFYYSLYDGSAVTNVSVDLNEDNRDILCGPGTTVEIPVLSQPSSASGFFAIGVLEIPMVYAPGEDHVITGLHFEIPKPRRR